MTVTSKTMRLDTKGNCDIVDITPEVAKEVSSSGMQSGTVTIFVDGSTAGVTTIEYEPGLVADLKGMWVRLIPQNMEYEHNRAWGDENGHSHVRAALLGASLTIPFMSKKMALGTWQQIVLIDFDNRSRSREIVIQILGE